MCAPVTIATPGRCCKCGRELVEQSVLVGERSYCVGCFVCGVCGATLAGKYYEVEGVVSCQECRWGNLVKVSTNFALIFTFIGEGYKDHTYPNQCLF